MRQLFFLFGLAVLLSGGLARADEKPARPNILWITSEDNSPYLGCYGDPLAKTPHLDALAASGVRYRNAFANAPVCSTARSTLITGMYACSAGVHHHRSRVAIPDEFQLYPEVLKAAGYYCTNNSKTDYNVANADQPWDESSGKAHYKNRQTGQPFFAVFNITTSHESRVAPQKGKDLTALAVQPEQVQLPPYHPDTPTIRLDWANYYDQVSRMDQEVGRLLAELEKSGAADNTIVFYYADHGGALPRGKRNIHDSGTRVPMIVRFPKAWSHLAPAKPGSWVEQPVSFVDLPATVMSLCEIPIPKNYQGHPFLGRAKTPPRSHVFLFRGRMDERYDNARAVRDEQYRYIRNYSPHRPWGQHYTYPFRVLPSMRSWYAEYEAGKCNDVQARYWQPKPGEEFYDTAADPFEIHNLIDDAKLAAKREQLKQALEAEMLAMRDTGFIPEGMFTRLPAQGQTIYEYAHSDAYPLERIIKLANLATERNPANLPQFQTALSDEHAVIRYWGALGCLLLQEKAAPAKEQLLAAMADDRLDVRVVAAEALGYLGETPAAAEALQGVLKNGNTYEILAALNTLEYMWRAGQIPLPQVQQMVQGLKLSEPADRIPGYLLGLK